MEVTVCQCRKCGRYHVFEKIGVRDIHVCECGERIERWTHRMEKCETEKEPNEPLGAWKRNGTDLVWHGDNSPEWIPPKKLTKKVTIDVEAGKGFKKLMKDINNASRKISKMPGIAFANNDGSVSVVPIISVDTKALIFQSDVALITSHKKELEKEYTERTGIECIILDGRAKLAAVIDG